MGVGLFVLGTPIIRLIFPELDASVAGPLLSTLGIASIFVCLMLVCNSVLQAHGFINLPVVIMALGGVVKIVTNYNLVAVPTIGISGAPVGNVLCFGLCMVLDLVVIARVIHGRPDYLPLLAKPAAAAGVMGLGAWAVYGLLSKLLSYGSHPDRDHHLCGFGGGSPRYLPGGPLPHAQRGQNRENFEAMS